jgi:hypothetical protein
MSFLVALAKGEMAIILSQSAAAVLKTPDATGVLRVIRDFWSFVSMKNRLFLDVIGQTLEVRFETIFSPVAVDEIANRKA